MTRLQEIMECMSNDIKPSWDDIVWLIEEVGQLTEENKKLHAQIDSMVIEINDITLVYEEQQKALNGDD